jgi:hypothetical protein
MAVMDLDSFPLFKLLPSEIRILIWEYSMTPGTVYTKPVGNSFIESHRKQANPPLLRVCHESRSVALSHYQLVPDIDKTYVNFNLDTVHIDYVDCLDLNILTLLPSKSEIRFQYLDIDWEWICMYGMDFLVEKVSRCHSLRQLTIVVKCIPAISEERETELSSAIAKYRDMTEDDASAYLTRLICNGHNMLTFDEHCEVISWGWADQARHRFPDRPKWPDIWAVSRARPVISLDLA